MQSQQRLIVFLIPPEKLVNGGILSIFSIAGVSRQFKAIHKSEVVIATYPGAASYGHNDLFDNDETIYDFNTLVKRGVPQSLLLHVPEYASGHVFEQLKQYRGYLAAVPELSINIMHQNTLLMQPPVMVANWFSLTPRVTQTTAHDKYTTQELADRYATPTRHLSTFVDAGQYDWVPFEEKKSLIALSPDITDRRQDIVDHLQAELPDYEIVTIQNMRYEEYKRFIGTAKFVLTFGEGFDGYYVEAFFTGGICLAVYNEEFFPDKSFAGFDNLYPSYEALLATVVADIKRLSEDKRRYQKINKQNLDKINSLYSFERYTDNVKRFYQGDFSYLPGPDSSPRLLGEVIVQRDQQLATSEATIRDREQKIDSLGHQLGLKDNAIRARDQQISDMKTSRSWRVTKPLRASAAIAKKKHSR